MSSMKLTVVFAKANTRWHSCRNTRKERADLSMKMTKGKPNRFRSCKEKQSRESFLNVR